MESHDYARPFYGRIRPTRGSEGDLKYEKAFVIFGPDSASPLTASAQETPRAELFIGYSYLHLDIIAMMEDS